MEQINPNVLPHSTTSSNYDISGKRSDPSLRYTGVKQKERIIQERAGLSPRRRRRPFTWATGHTSATSPGSCSADDTTAGADSLDPSSRQSIVKMSDAAETKKTNVEPVRRPQAKRRMKVTSSSDVKEEGKGEEKGEAKGEVKVDAKKTASRNIVRRSTNSAGRLANTLAPVIRVKVSPSGTTQSAAPKLAGDNDRQVSTDGSSNVQDASQKRRPQRRKPKAKAEESGGQRGDKSMSAEHSGILKSGPTTATSLTAPSRTSPLHCAFLNALKECSPRLIAALSATNEAAFLNAMWSCFWRGYRAGFQICRLCAGQRPRAGGQ